MPPGDEFEVAAGSSSGSSSSPPSKVGSRPASSRSREEEWEQRDEQERERGVGARDNVREVNKMIMSLTNNVREVNKMIMSLTNESHMSYESKGFRVGAIAGVGSKINNSKKFRQPLLSKVGAPNRGY
jgi:hypothetical protein